MASSKILKHYALERNPFTDRTAEKSNLSPEAYYLLSDMEGFKPNETTYLFFGKRGSGKTTIRTQMLRTYEEYNRKATIGGEVKPHFVVDLCKPGHTTACLRHFQDHLGCADDSWDARFSDKWQSADLVDCILSYAATLLVEEMRVPGPCANKMLDILRKDEKHKKQFLLLAHIYAHADYTTLADLRDKLMPGRSAMLLAATAASSLFGTGAALVGAAAMTDKRASHIAQKLSDVCVQMLPTSLKSPKAIVGAAVVTAAGAYFVKQRRTTSYCAKRAQQLLNPVHVVPHRSLDIVQNVVDSLFAIADNCDTIRSNYLGNSGHQKLELLQNLVCALGYQSVAVFGDCFDEVGLLDPVSYPGALKAFAREVCKNDILNFGRLHFFFPDSRIALDLNTDRVLKEARFDRHFVRDLVWSRHQLEDLAERRWRACQASDPSKNEDDTPRFADLFSKVGAEDFSSSLAKLHTPRELLIMMTEMLARIEAHNDGEYVVAAQDMEIAVSKAAEQAL
mmetsp:Transcript_14825/g.25098  ORF Transcript_14825/g.25098 Transcript_14825/m.25098 type:complete len:508 (-) Transcript_14825:305-1828(-)|eukprot:CAMPEP_0198197972 /NCGR_PEP_ID=MMETSP1445-20131203/1512_1 /TAXON_ID=36898 /ORGANISM="Pyramimonas sp., Strain CCMP2087" /LENGTH=507 /DNA_ID=CAMNT_0043867397 /DNA_START=106 /DNA_END=1629 /DNA_ORIENTATION=+